MSQKAAGYIKRPLELTVIAWIFFLVPVINVLGWTISYMLIGKGWSLAQVLTYNLGTFTEGFWGIIHFSSLVGLWALFIVVGIGILLVKKWGFFLCIVAASANWVFSWFIFRFEELGIPIKTAPELNPFQPSALINLVFFIPVLIILQKDIMAPFFNPRLKWWEQHKRVKASLTIEARIAGKSAEYQTFDLSTQGLFLATPDASTLSIGDLFAGSIRLEGSGEKLPISCRVVWISQGGGHYPAGIGCTFVDQKPSEAKILKKYIRDLIEEGQLHQRT